MGRSPCCSKEGLNRGAWTAMEDQILTSYIKAHGEGKWRNLPKFAGLKKCGKSCRLRWLNYLRPDIKRGNISQDEELIIRLHKLLGNRWSLIAGRLPGRTDNEIKNYWNTTLGKKSKPPARSLTSTTQPSPKGKTRPVADQQPSSSAPAAKATRPRVVRARPTLLNIDDLVQSNPNLPFNDHNSGLGSNSQGGSIGQYAQDSDISRIQFLTDDWDIQENWPSDFDFLDFGYGDGRFQASNIDRAGEKTSYIGNYYSNINISMEEAILEKWASEGGGVEEINKGTLDIESLTSFLFDSEQRTFP